MMDKPCFFCKKKEGIRILNIKEKVSGERHPVCHICFNKWSTLKEGILYKGERHHLK